MHGARLGETIMQNAARTDKRDLLVPAPWHRRDAEKTVFYTKAGDQICGVGYTKITSGHLCALMAMADMPPR
jgi:hypothetical protein